VSWAETDEQALEQVRKWKGAQPEDHYTADKHEPRRMYEHGEEETSDEELAPNVIAGSDPEAIQDRLREIERLGATVIVMQNSSSADPERAIRLLGSDVLPVLRGARV
jgi:coenzyme F420-dependent glucose-6-phosphate dehydrogenase